MSCLLGSFLLKMPVCPGDYCRHAVFTKDSLAFSKTSDPTGLRIERQLMATSAGLESQQINNYGGINVLPV